MRPGTRNTNTILPPGNISHTGALAGHKGYAYRTFLYSIAARFELSEQEAREMVEEIFRAAVREHSVREEGLPLKLWLSKRFVHQCVFRISSRMFSQKGKESVQATDNVSRPSTLSNVPFSFRTVYILSSLIGFTEPEVAQILNITPIQVRERMGRAVAMMERS